MQKVWQYKQLQKVRKSIEIKDLMIAATSKSLNYPLATINEKHYIHIDGLKLITPGNL
jgi:predicted nucleic acid-binding protein